MKRGEREKRMEKSALVVIDLQNDITKNYRDIIDGVNEAIRRAEARGMEIVFKTGTHGEELVPELRVASEHCFVKSKSSALTSEAFAEFIEGSGVREFFLCGADAAACVKSTAYNMAKAGYAVHVLSDCVTSYDRKKIPEMLDYYAAKGCAVAPLAESL